MGKPITKKPKQTHEFVRAVAAKLGPESIQVLDPAKHGSKEEVHQGQALPSVKLNFVPPCQTQAALVGTPASTCASAIIGAQHAQNL